MLVVMVLVLLVIVVVLGHRCLRGCRTIVRSRSSRIRLVGARVLRHPILSGAG